MLNWIKEKIGSNGRRPARENDQIPFAIPVLCYHSGTIYGTTYETSDHVALEQDLRILADRGYQILPVTDLLDLLDGTLSARRIKGKKLVCLTFDDGRDLDYRAYQSKAWGAVKSFHKILEDSVSVLPLFSQGPRAVSFVIASKEARTILDQTCGDGKGEWQDEWWRECASGGLLGIANHSWDHLHDTLQNVRQRDNLKGSFHEINTFEDAEAQIAEAQRYIDTITNHQSLPVFAYPFGHVSAYIRDEYFPEYGTRLGLKGAFSTKGASVRPDTCIWSIPRFVRGGHWETREDFERILDAVERGER